MNQSTNHWKLGLFVVIAFLLLLTALVYFGTSSLNDKSVTYRSYFDEAVTGLEIGSTVKFRGVTIGTVSAIDVAKDRRHVETSYQLGIEVLEHLGIATQKGGETKISVPKDLRAQVGSMGITGQKYILIDFVDSKAPPPVTLPFPVAENYIPAAPSLMKSVEDSVVRAVDRFPELAEDVGRLLGTANRMLTDFESKQLGTRAEETLEQTNQLLTALTVKVHQVPAAELSEEARKTLLGAQKAVENMNLTMTKLQAVIDRVDGDRGLVASMQRATDSVGDVAVSADGVSDDLGDTLRDVREAAISVRQFLDALELDSDMLVKGRAELDE